MIVLKFKKDIKGECTTSGYEGWINVDNVAFGVGRSIQSVSEGSDKRDVSTPTISEVAISRSTDLASPEFFFQACGGQTLELATINIVQVENNEPKVHVAIELTDPIVSGYSISTGGDNPSESVTLNFTKISFQYNSFDGKKVTQSAAKKWDLSKNVTF